MNRSMGVDAWPAGIDLSCIHGSQTDWSNHTVIVPAVFREWHGHGPPDWLSKQYPVYLYQRLNSSVPCYCANRGYESGVYFKFIAHHFARLPAFAAFIQADWIFMTKTHYGGPFRFWQPQCVGDAAAGQQWADYMPLGGRRSVWPPRCVARELSWYGRLVGRKNVAIIEACARELLAIVEWQGTVPPHNRTDPLNVTFFTNMNFIASRTRLHRYSHRAYRTLAHRFLEEGVCVPPSPASATSGLSEIVMDSPSFAKVTLGMTTELLQQALFGDSPLENGPPPEVPVDSEHCSTRAMSTCALSA